MNEQDAPADLVRMISAGTPECVEAAAALQHRIGELARRSLLSLLAASDSEDVLCAAAYALGGDEDEHARRTLINIARSAERSARLRGHALESLRLINHRDVVSLLRFLATDRDPRVRYWAIFGLGWQGDVEDIPALNVIAARDNEWGNFGSVADEARAAIAEIIDRSRAEKRE